MIKKIALIVSTILVLFLGAYSYFWYTISNNIVNAVNTTNTKALEHLLKRKIVIGDVSISGFPFKFGVKIASLKEENPEGIITHDGSIYLGYDILHQRTYISFDVKSAYNSKPLHSNGAKETYVDFKSDLYAKIKSSFDIFQILSKQERVFEIVNFIKSIENNSDIKIYSVSDKALLLDQTIKAQLNIENNNYYHNIDELTSDETCSKYYVNSNIAIKEAKLEGCYIPGSIIYRMFSRNISTGTTEFDAVISISPKNLWKDSEITIKKLKYDTINYSGESAIYTKLKITTGNVSMDLAVKNELKLKDKFFDYINHSMFKTISDISKSGVPSTIALSINDIAENPEKYYFPAIDLKTIDTKIDLSFVGKDDNINVDIRQFDLFFDETGIRISDKIVLDSKFSFATNGLLSIRNNENIFKYWYSYLKQIFPDNEYYSDDRVFLINKSVSEFLRAISNHPESNSNEMFFDISFDSVTQNLTIGKTKSIDMLALYKHTLYKNALALASNDSDFMSKAPKLVPELISDNNLMQALAKASSNAKKGSVVNGVQDLKQDSTSYNPNAKVQPSSNITTDNVK